MTSPEAGIEKFITKSSFFSIEMTLSFRLSPQSLCTVKVLIFPTLKSIVIQSNKAQHTTDNVLIQYTRRRKFFVYFLQNKGGDEEEEEEDLVKIENTSVHRYT